MIRFIGIAREGIASAPENPGCCRREWLKASGRWAILSALGSGAITLVARGQVIGCRRGAACEVCLQFAGCELPPAVQARASAAPRSQSTPLASPATAARTRAALQDVDATDQALRRAPRTDDQEPRHG